MAYLGNAPARSFISFERQVFTIVNSQTAYTLSHSVNNENDIRLVINNIVQEPGSGKAYTASGTTLTLSAALTNGTDEMYCVFLGRAVATNAPGAGSVNTASIADLNVTTAKLADSSVSLAKLTATGTKDATTFLRGDNTFAEASGKFESQLLQVRHETASGTHGGDAVANTDNVRILNTVVTNEITGASLSSNRITLPSGTYYINSVGISYDTATHRIILYNYTDSSVTLLGLMVYADVNNEVANHSFLSGRFTISSQKVFEIRHFTESAKSTLGLGVSGGDSRTNVFADVQIWKVA